MKNNKIDSKILDDNYIPEEEKSPQKIENLILNFFKVIGSTFFHSILFLAVIIVFSIILDTIRFSIYGSRRDREIFSLIAIFLSYIPFLYYLFFQIKKEQLLKKNWKIAVSILTFLISIFISLLIFVATNLSF